MEPILISCAGMDVHEKKVDVCIAHGPFDKPPKFEIRTFSTMTSDLEELMGSSLFPMKNKETKS